MRPSLRITLLTALLASPLVLHAQSGVVHERSFTHGGLLRSYLLYVPAAYDGTTDWPLVLNYHGYSSSPQGQMRISEMNAVADTAGFFVAYPQGLVVNDPFDGPGVGWDFDGTLSDHDDVGFTAGLIDHVAADFMVDPTRIHATGFSMGSQMIWGLACALPGTVASVAGVSGPMDDAYIESCDPGRPYSVLLMHGTDDLYWPPEGVRVGGYEFGPPTATPMFWALQNKCASPEPTVTDLENVDANDRSTVVLIDYGSCDDATEVQYYEINGGGHTWPGGGSLPPFLGSINRDIHASSEIWAFFDRNPHLTPGGTVDLEPSDPAAAFHLDAYPNPFVDRVTLSFTLDRPADVRITVVDVLGRAVARITPQTLAEGRHRVVWQAPKANLASGLYFLRMQVGDVWVTRTVMHKGRGLD